MTDHNSKSLCLLFLSTPYKLLPTKARAKTRHYNPRPKINQRVATLTIVHVNLPLKASILNHGLKE